MSQAVRRLDQRCLQSLEGYASPQTSRTRHRYFYLERHSTRLWYEEAPCGFIRVEERGRIVGRFQGNQEVDQQISDRLLPRTSRPYYQASNRSSVTHAQTSILSAMEKKGIRPSIADEAEYRPERFGNVAATRAGLQAIPVYDRNTALRGEAVSGSRPDSKCTSKQVQQINVKLLNTASKRIINSHSSCIINHHRTFCPFPLHNYVLCVSRTFICILLSQYSL